MSDFNVLSAEDALEVDRLCDEFESAWKSGRRPSLKDWLSRVSQSRNQEYLLREMLFVDRWYRSQSGETPIPSDYPAKFREQFDSIFRDVFETQLLDAKKERATADESRPMDIPAKIGRYRVERFLGKGSFGLVLLARDNDLARSVAIKVPHTERLLSPEDVSRYQAEAQVVAGLDHPNIVPVYDVGSTSEYACYVVSRYVDGSDMAARIANGPVSRDEAIRWVRDIAEALQYSHEHGLVHRDIKPANILLDQSGKPYLTDFGAAKQNERLAAGSPEAGTPAYMSPEQASGEGHRVDARSDTFSLGIVLYQLLTGERPFRAKTTSELLRSIQQANISPSILVEQNIPQELRRICLKSLARRAADRYQTADDFAEDLRQYSAASATGPQVSPDSPLSGVIPKGLRRYDSSDSDFFLQLLPGPRDRNGMPESVRFWKTHIESSFQEQAIPVGVIYGPSGCGKSSLVRAGLLPVLSDEISTVLIDATVGGTEQRLLDGLNGICRPQNAGSGLSDFVAALRHGEGPVSGQKVLIVLDQFEQWLSSRHNDAELVQALRQCDGRHVQCLLIVRDDFWTGVSAFLQELEHPLVDRSNAMPVELFPEQHARIVLDAFGKAHEYHSEPAASQSASEDRDRFLTESVAELAEEGKVSAVRLAIFVEMMKRRPWTVKTLQELGGVTGLGIRFFEETFALPEYRHLRSAAQAALEQLLPPGAGLERPLRTASELQPQTEERPGQPSESSSVLIQTLDSDLHLMTPVIENTDQIEGEVNQQTAGQERRYQLTHEFLVQPLREWLTASRKATARGRARLRLAEFSGLWNARPENHRLPPFQMWISFVLLVPGSLRCESEQKMLRQANRFHGIRILLTCCFLLIITLAGVFINQRIALSHQNRVVAGMVQTLLNAEMDRVPELLEQIEPYWIQAVPALKRVAQSDQDSHAKLNACLALLADEPDSLEYVNGKLLAADPKDVAVIRSVLRQDGEPPVDSWWQILAQPETAQDHQVLVAAAALAICDSGSGTQWSDTAPLIAQALTRQSPFRAMAWADLIRPVRNELVSTLEEIYRNASGEYSQSEVDSATTVLADYARDDLHAIASFLFDAEPRQFSMLFDSFASHGPQQALAVIDSELNQELAPDWNDNRLKDDWNEPSRATIRQIEEAQGGLSKRFAFCQILPLDDFEALTKELNHSGYRPVCLRPFRHGNATLAAAIWRRDGHKWRVATGLSVDEIRSLNEENNNNGYRPLQVAVYHNADGELHQQLYAGIWTLKRKNDPDYRMYVGVDYGLHDEYLQQLSEEGFKIQKSLQARYGPEQSAQYCGIRERRAGVSLLGKNSSQVRLDQLSYLHRICEDLGMIPASQLNDWKKLFRRALEDAEATLAKNPTDLMALYERAKSYQFLARPESALIDLDYVISKVEADPELDTVGWLLKSSYLKRFLAHQQLKHIEDARADYKSFQILTNGAYLHTEAYMQALLSVSTEQAQSGIQALNNLVESHPGDEDVYHDAICAFSLMSKQLRDSRPGQAQVCEARCVELIDDALTDGVLDISTLEADPDLEAIQQSDRYAELVSRHRPRLRYTEVWNTSTEFESQQLFGLPSDEHLSRADQLDEQGFRPVALSSLTHAGQVLVSSVWHRPLVTHEAKDKSVRRQANAVIAAWKLGERSRAWPRLSHQADPSLQTEIIYRIKSANIDLLPIADRLATEPDNTVKAALIEALGDCVTAASARRLDLGSPLLALYRSSPDSGVHSAAEWTLKRWGMGEETDQAAAALETPANSEWYLTKTHNHCMAVRQIPDVITMGSPATEAGRKKTEYRHQITIGRQVALASKEVTVRQYEDYLKESSQKAHNFSEEVAPEKECPQVSLAWFHAAQYCRWLSEQERIPENQMCYPPIADIKAGMQLPEDFLKRTGYRLPTEAEWEFFCRAGSTTSRYAGRSDQLLADYAWYAGSRTWPVGILKPNRYGLFDVYGNVTEWCQDEFQSYATRVGYVTSEDNQIQTQVPSNRRHVMRGSYYKSAAHELRSAIRLPGSPATQYLFSGFRIARTIH